MTTYLMRFSYTPATWARLREHPEDRSAALRGYMDSVGGTVHGF